MKYRRNVAKQASYFEIEHLNCLSCGDDVRHPLCPHCLAEGFIQWLEKFPNDSNDIREKVEEFLKGNKSIIHKYKSKACVSCGKRRTYVCPKCFTEYLYNLVKEAGLGVRAMTEFLFMFNFDFERKGYAKELEVFGGY